MTIRFVILLLCNHILIQDQFRYWKFSCGCLLLWVFVALLACKSGTDWRSEWVEKQNPLDWKSEWVETQNPLDWTT